MSRHSATVTDGRDSNAMSSPWPAIMTWVASTRHVGGAHTLGGRLFEHDLEGQRGQRVAGDDGLPDPELAPYRRAVSPLGVAVDDVIVDEREVVDQLDGHGTDDAGLLGCSRR